MRTEFRTFLVDLVSDLIAANVLPAKCRSGSQQDEMMPPDCYRPMSESCIDLQPKSCSSESLFRCNPTVGEMRFNCSDDPSNPVKAFDCDFQSAFTCQVDRFDCRGDFICSNQQQFQCDADMYECSSYRADSEVGKFDCAGGSGKSFDCTDGRAFDFMCDRSPWPPGEGAGFECSDPDGLFECSPKHIFRCYSTFDCPSTHHCKPPKRTCSPEQEGWAPPEGDRDDGDAGDFDCLKFTCGSSEPGDPQQKFDCGLSEGEGGPSSDFKCLDGTGGLEEQFNCGMLSEFECGEEEERFVCMNYRCETDFRCQSLFHCGNKDEPLSYTYTCLPHFQCLPMSTNPAEDGYACDGNPGGFVCEDYNCDQEGYNCNPLNEFAGTHPVP